MNNPHLVRKTNNPTSAPPEAGIHWVNTTTGKEFFSVGTSTVNDWVERNPAFTGAISTVVNTNLNNNIVVVSNASGKIDSSSVSSTTLGYLDATSSVQTQINSKANDVDVIKKNGSVAFTADQSMGTHKLTNVVDPSSAQDAATKAYVDNLITGLDWKEAVHAATIADINLTSAPAVIDSHTLNPGERVLVKNQAIAADNGIYLFNGAGSAMTRALDADTWLEIVHSIVFVEQGTVNGGSKWNNTNVAGGTLGVTAINFTLFSATSTISGAGTSDYNAYWTSSGTLAGEQFVSQTRGGLGTSAAGFNGVVKTNSGVFSASSITNSDVDVTAAIAFNKMATLTANKVTVTDSSGVVTTALTSNVEIDYLQGVTSSVQTQLNSKQANITGAATSVITSDLTASRAVVSDASGKISASSVTASEVNYLSGVSSNVQTQLNGKEPTVSRYNLNASSPLLIAGTGKILDDNITLSIPQASDANSGYVSDADFINLYRKTDSFEIPRGYRWQNNSTTVGLENIAAGTATGTATAVSYAATNYQTQQIRSRFQVSTPAANGICGYRSTQLLWKYQSGFRFVIGFCHTDSQYNSGARQFYGLASTTSQIAISSTVTVDSLTNIIGIGSDAGDSYLSIYVNGTSGTATKIGLSSLFSANRDAVNASTDWFRIELWNPARSNSIYYRAFAYNSGITMAGSFVPVSAPTSALSVHAVRTSGSSSNQCSFDLSQLMVFSQS